MKFVRKICAFNVDEIDTRLQYNILFLKFLLIMTIKIIII